MAFLISDNDKGVLPAQEGMILQRGGEELRVYKVNNRLTLCSSDLTALQQLNDQWKPQQIRNVTPQAIHQSPVIVEWKLPGHQLENALSALRRAAGVIYARDRKSVV